MSESSVDSSTCVQCGAPMEPERQGGHYGVAGPGGLIVWDTGIIPAQCSEPECGERAAE